MIEQDNGSSVAAARGRSSRRRSLSLREIIMNARFSPENLRPSGQRAAGELERNGRDGRGRFAPGSPGVPINPFARRVAALRRAMLDTIGDEEIRAITTTLIELAHDGNLAAARLVLEYGLG
jgi:hypothetical protein